MADETDRLDPQPGEPFKLQTGLELRIIPMQTRQIMRLMRILTHGAGAAMLSTGGLDFGADPGEFVQKLTYMALLAIPDAEDETMQFLASMVEPVGLLKPRAGESLDEKAQAKNNDLWQRVNTDMFNPDPLDTIEVIERIIVQEAEDIQGLGKRLGRTFKLLQKTGQVPEPAVAAEPGLPSPQELSEKTAPPPQPSPPSVAPSPPPSMPSAPSTDGATSTSSPSPSAASGLSEPPSVLAGQPEPTTAVT